MLDRVSPTEKFQLQSLISSISKDISDCNHSNIDKKVAEVRSILPKNSLPENSKLTQEPSSTKETLLQLINFSDKHNLVSIISEIAGDIASYPKHHVLTDDYWLSSDYGPEKNGSLWRDTKTVDERTNTIYAQRYADIFLNSLITNSDIEIPDTSDGRYKYMVRSRQVTEKILKSVYLTIQLLQSNPDDQLAAGITTDIYNTLNEFPTGTIEKVIKSTIDLVANNKAPENKRYSLSNNTTNIENSTKKEIDKAQEYFDIHLAPALPKLGEIYNKELGYINNEKVAVICLDRDTRALMHSLKAYLDNPCKFIPLLANSNQFKDELEFYNNQIQNDILLTATHIDTPRKWSSEVKNRFDSRTFPNLLYWRDVFGATLEKSLQNKTKVLIIDIGYHGSTLELVRYILSKAFPKTEFITAIAYQSDIEIPIQMAVEGNTLQAEEETPKSVTGLEVQEGKLKYLQDTKKLVMDSIFYKEIIEATKKFKAKTQNN